MYWEGGAAYALSGVAAAGVLVYPLARVTAGYGAGVVAGAEDVTPEPAADVTGTEE